MCRRVLKAMMKLNAAFSQTHFSGVTKFLHYRVRLTLNVPHTTATHCNYVMHVDIPSKPNERQFVFDPFVHG